MVCVGDSMIFAEENYEKCSVRAVKVNICMRKFAFGHFLGRNFALEEYLACF